MLTRSLNLYWIGWEYAGLLIGISIVSLFFQPFKHKNNGKILVGGLIVIAVVIAMLGMFLD